MLIAEGVDWVAVLSDKGLAVAIVVFGLLGLWRLVSFGAPLIRDAIASTLSLHETLKETSIKQTALMDDHSEKLGEHSEKLSAIRAALQSNRCPMIGQTAVTPVAPETKGAQGWLV